MQRSLAIFAVVCLLYGAALTARARSQQPAPTPASTAAGAGIAAPLPDPHTLLLQVEANEKRLEALRKDYTYHVHLQEQELDKNGAVKKTAITDSESLTLEGVRVNRVVARNGQPLTAAEQAKESERLDKEVAKARERRAKAARKGEETDERGDTILSAARILELGTFSNERRVELNGRPTIVLDYAGDPGAKTHSPVENVVRDLVGTVWIDEGDRVLVRGEGHFLNDFKIGGGLLADVRKGTRFQFEARRLNDGVWLPATIDGQGSVRLLLFVGFNGRMNLVASDYRRFRTSATVLAGQTVLGSPDPSSGATPTPQPANGVSGAQPAASSPKAKQPRETPPGPGQP